MKLSKIFGVSGWIATAAVFLSSLVASSFDLKLFEQPMQLVMAGSAAMIFFVLSQSFASLEDSRSLAHH